MTLTNHCGLIPFQILIHLVSTMTGNLSRRCISFVRSFFCFVFLNFVVDFLSTSLSSSVECFVGQYSMWRVTWSKKIPALNVFLPSLDCLHPDDGSGPWFWSVNLQYTDIQYKNIDENELWRSTVIVAFHFYFKVALSLRFNTSVVN